MDIYYVDRKSKEKKKELIAGEKLMRWTFESRAGMMLLETIVKKKFISKLYGAVQDMSFSKNKISSFVSDFNIDMSEAMREHPDDYENFNDFFSRRLKPYARAVDIRDSVLISPADGKMLAYSDIDIDSLYQVKDSKFSLSTLLGDPLLADEYLGGTFVVIRLAPSDYHRFHFIDDCSISSHFKADGHLYSVNPLSLRAIPKVYCQNKREVSVLDSKNFGKVLYIEVGATFVGSIVQTFNSDFEQKRGAEKGYFKFGGSTVILLFKKDTVKIDPDIMENTALGLETSVRMGEKIGNRIDPN